MATATSGAEVSIRATTEVINPAAIPPINIVTDDISKYSSDSDTSYDSGEDIDTYKAQYVEENYDINFCKDLVPDIVDGLETMVFFDNWPLCPEIQGGESPQQTREQVLPMQAHKSQIVRSDKCSNGSIPDRFQAQNAVSWVEHTEEWSNE